MRAGAVIATLVVAIVVAGDARGDDELRVRAGASLIGGLAFGGPLAFGGVQGRIGVQANRFMAIYAEPELVGGGPFRGSGVVAIAGGSPMFEVTVADLFFVGAGPCLFGGGYATNTGDVEIGLVPGGKIKVGLGV